MQLWGAHWCSLIFWNFVHRRIRNEGRRFGKRVLPVDGSRAGYRNVVPYYKLDDAQKPPRKKIMSVSLPPLAYDYSALSQQLHVQSGHHWALLQWQLNRVKWIHSAWVQTALLVAVWQWQWLLLGQLSTHWRVFVEYRITSRHREAIQPVNVTTQTGNTAC